MLTVCGTSNNLCTDQHPGYAKLNSHFFTVLICKHHLLGNISMQLIMGGKASYKTLHSTSKYDMVTPLCFQFKTVKSILMLFWSPSNSVTDRDIFINNNIIIMVLENIFLFFQVWYVV